METKLAKLKAFWQAGDKLAALRIAAKFPSLGNEKEAITRGWAAYQNPDFYRQLGKDPASLLELAFLALASRYSLS